MFYSGFQLTEVCIKVKFSWGNMNYIWVKGSNSGLLRGWFRRVTFIDVLNTIKLVDSYIFNWVTVRGVLDLKHDKMSVADQGRWIGWLASPPPPPPPPIPDIHSDILDLSSAIPVFTGQLTPSQSNHPPLFFSRSPTECWYPVYSCRWMHF